MVSLLAAENWECGCREVGVWDLMRLLRLNDLQVRNFLYKN